MKYYIKYVDPIPAGFGHLFVLRDIDYEGNWKFDHNPQYYPLKFCRYIIKQIYILQPFHKDRFKIIEK